MGSSFKSTLLALSRDVIFFVPAIIIIANISNSVFTMLWSSVVADVFSFITAVILLRIEFKRMDNIKEKSAHEDEK